MAEPLRLEDLFKIARKSILFSKSIKKPERDFKLNKMKS